MKLCARIRQSNIIFICFSLISPTSFDEIECQIEKIDRCRDMRGEYTNIDDINLPGIILVGCKCDLDEMRRVYLEQIIKTVNKYNIPYIETSAKDDINIDLLFKLCIYEYWIQHNHQTMTLP